MAALILRKFKRRQESNSHVHHLFTSSDISTTPPATFRNSQNLPDNNTTRSRKYISTVTHPDSIADKHWQIGSPVSYAKSLRTIAKRASVFGFRDKRREHPSTSCEPRASRAHTLLAFANELADYNLEPHRSISTSSEGTDSNDTGALFPPPIRPSIPSSSFAIRADRSPSPPHFQYECVATDLSTVHDFIHCQRQALRRAESIDTCVSICVETLYNTMAADQSLPVSYERLRQLTTEACDSTLSSIKAYSHTDTESWNSKIINTILSALVQESTPPSTDGSVSQPNYKFIVNSTIIQHAAIQAGAGDDAVRRAGRRGMHSASGAFWNNEKDGMWSFKYEAAEAKGLDVVVGIVWIWVS